MASPGGLFSSPEEVQKWLDAVQLYDAGQVNSAIGKFEHVMSCAKMLFNIGCCQLEINQIDAAVKSYEAAIQMDPHMAVSYFTIGLVYYLKNDLNESFDYFERSRSAMRGNKYIDYSQLGLNYKLYCCEIRTNQASILVKQNKIGKAKEMLLLAIACKAEKRHENISHSLNMLQAGAGFAMSLFILPRHVIFRPSQKIINQLEKKDYLGKSKVMATENSEDIYACFSGLRVQKEAQIPNHVNDRDVQTMLTDIKRTDSKERLKRTPPQKKLPALKMGKVVDNKLVNTSSQEYILKCDENNSNPPRRPPLPVAPAKRYSQVISSSNKKENIILRSQSPPPRPPPVRNKRPVSGLPHSKTFDCITSSVRTSSVSLTELRKDVGKPPAPQKYVSKVTGNCNGSNDSKDTQQYNGVNKHYSGNTGHYNGGCSDDEQYNPDRNGLGGNNNFHQYKHVSYSGNNNSNNSPEKKVHEVEIFYSFSHKVRLKEGLSLSEIENIVEAQTVPDDITICTTDEHGKRQVLTEKRLQELFKRNCSNKKELFCVKSPVNQSDLT